MVSGDENDDGNEVNFSNLTNVQEVKDKDDGGKKLGMGTGKVSKESGGGKKLKRLKQQINVSSDEELEIEGVED